MSARITDGLTKSQRYNRRHPEKRKAQWALHRHKNREKRNAQKRLWSQNNAAWVRIYQEAWKRLQPPQFWQRWPSHNPQHKKVEDRKRRRELYHCYLNEIRRIRKEPHDQSTDDQIRDQLQAKRARRFFRFAAGAAAIGSHQS